MKAMVMAAIVAAAIMISAPVFAPTASTQPHQDAANKVHLAAALVGAAAGATLAVLL
jgi:uncharacterized membrane protein